METQAKGLTDSKTPGANTYADRKSVAAQGKSDQKDFPKRQ
jgi:hypothetical protein